MKVNYNPVTSDPVQLLHQEPTGQVRLIEFEGRFLEVMEAHFGEPFIEYRRMWSESSRFALRPDFPLSLDLEVNASCNLSCVMCVMASPGYKNPMSEEPIMDWGLYIRLMKQAETMGLPAMTFGYLSEPLLRPDIAEMISLARDAGVMDIRLGTNGTLLGKKVAKELIRAGLTRLEVSLDALDPRTYRSIRRGGSLPKVVRNIMDFLELRSAMGSRIPVLRLSFLRLPQNEAELEGFLSFWRDKAELFSIQEPIFYPEAPLSKLVDLTESPPPGNFRCAQPWQRLIIRSNGDVYPCCSQLSPKMKVGSAKQDSLLELWQSRLMQGLRQAQKEGRYREYPDCLDCAAGAARRPIRRTASADGERA